MNLVEEFTHDFKENSKDGNRIVAGRGTVTVATKEDIEYCPYDPKLVTTHCTHTKNFKCFDNANERVSLPKLIQIAKEHDEVLTLKEAFKMPVQVGFPSKPKLSAPTCENSILALCTRQAGTLTAADPKVVSYATQL